MNWTRAKRTCACVVLAHPRPRKSARAMRSNLPPRLTYPESASGEPTGARPEETPAKRPRERSIDKNQPQKMPSIEVTVFDKPGVGRSMGAFK